MRTQAVEVVWTIGELAGVPLGTRIATNDNKLLVLDQYCGSRYWFAEGGLTPYSAMVHWLPAFILPRVVEQKADLEGV